MFGKKRENQLKSLVTILCNAIHHQNEANRYLNGGEYGDEICLFLAGEQLQAAGHQLQSAEVFMARMLKDKLSTKEYKKLLENAQKIVAESDRRIAEKNKKDDK